MSVLFPDAFVNESAPSVRSGSSQRMFAKELNTGFDL